MAHFGSGPILAIKAPTNQKVTCGDTGGSECVNRWLWFERPGQRKLGKYLMNNVLTWERIGRRGGEDETFGID